MSGVEYTEAVEAAAEYQFGIDHTYCGDVWIDADPVVKHLYREAVLGTVAAAVPSIEAQVRAQVVAELVAWRESVVETRMTVTVPYALDVAIRIARGDS